MMIIIDELYLTLLFGFVFRYIGPTTISLYQILYEEKELKAGYGHIYKVHTIFKQYLAWLNELIRV